MVFNIQKIYYGEMYIRLIVREDYGSFCLWGVDMDNGRCHKWKW